MQVCLRSLPQGTPADVLYKGTITRLITEDSASRAERERDEALSKGHVVYEGISGHILTYDRKNSSLPAVHFSTPLPTITIFFFVVRSGSFPTNGIYEMNNNYYYFIDYWLYAEEVFCNL